MQTVQQIVPISDFRINQDDVLEMMDKEPVILAQRSRPRAVLVSVADWNTMVKQLQERRFTQAEVEAILEGYQRSIENRQRVSSKELKANLAERECVEHRV